jgi:hypothetical protein
MNYAERVGCPVVLQACSLLVPAGNHGFLIAIIDRSADWVVGVRDSSDIHGRNLSNLASLEDTNCFASLGAEAASRGPSLISERSGVSMKLHFSHTPSGQRGHSDAFGELTVLGEPCRFARGRICLVYFESRGMDRCSGLRVAFIGIERQGSCRPLIAEIGWIP